MDSVRFGRALGFGARSAARALAGAVDAASAPNPAKSRQPAGTASVSSARSAPTNNPGDLIASSARAAARASANAATQATTTRESLRRGRKRFGEAAWGPFVKLSGVLWLEITGSFFGIFALFAGSTAWSRRAELHAPANHDARIHAFVFLAMTLVFGYFCISSFVRAYRK